MSAAATGDLSPGSAADVDLSSCDREPIHVPGSIQPHGLLLVLDDDLRLLQASANLAALAGEAVDGLIGAPLSRLMGGALEPLVRRALAAIPPPRPVMIGRAELGERRLPHHVTIHRAADNALIVELEPDAGEIDATHDLYRLLGDFVQKLQGRTSTAELGQLAAAEVRRITGFDRVLVYQFDEEWNGTVIAEDVGDAFPPYLDLRFPASDIPRQARELYRVNPIRLIADASYTPVPIVPTPNPLTGRPGDLSFSALRSVSPVHVEYLKNMGVASSMSISIMRGPELWGLIACHHREPLRPSLHARRACEMMGQILSLQLQARQSQADADGRMRLRGLLVQLLAAMAKADDFVEGLRDREAELLSYANAQGAAICFGQHCVRIGQAPDEDRVRSLVEWLAAESREEVFHTDRLPHLMPDVDGLKDRASGILAIELSKLHHSYLIWFRPEVIRAVAWGGDPRKPVSGDLNSERLHPRKSFEQWKEVVHERSLPWQPTELEAAVELRNAIIGIVLRRAEEMAELSAELERSNKELEAFSYSVSHDLRAPFRHIVGFSELIRELEGDRLSDRGRRYVDTVIESARYAGSLVDHLLHFSQMARTGLMPIDLDMDALVGEVRQRLLMDTRDRDIEWDVRPLARATGDATMIRLVWQNLIGNAVKFTRDRAPARISIASHDEQNEVIYRVQDNGVGFEMKYVDKLFGVFQRLHRMEEYEGTGIGLANVRRIVTRHGGRAWAEGTLGEGATFYFSLPRKGSQEAKLKGMTEI